MSRDMTFSDFDYDITNYRNSSDYDIMQDDIDNIDQAIEMKFQERFTKAGRKLAIADLYIEKCKKEGKKFSQYSEAVLSKAKKFQRKALNQIAK